MISKQKYILDCPRWPFCSTPVYTSHCSDICFKMKAKYADLFSRVSTARWKNRAEHNDFLWAECSNCGFCIENYKAVKVSASSTKYEDVIYRFCPMCGKLMEV